MDAAELWQYDLKNLIFHTKFGFQILEMSEIVPMPYPICLLKMFFEYILISFWAIWRMCLVCLNINWCYGWSRIFWSYINPNPLLICSEREAKLEVSTSSFCKSGDCLFSHQEKYISWKYLLLFLFINI